MVIRYIVGDATEPQGDGKKFIVHICNDIGAWGAGFVMALSAKWPDPERSYRYWWEQRDDAFDPFVLGRVQYVPVEKSIWVVNMIAQSGVVGPDNPKPINYAALAKTLNSVSVVAMNIGASIHMPRIGCGLAGGKWEEVQPVIENYMHPDLDIYVYDLE